MTSDPAAPLEARDLACRRGERKLFGGLNLALRPGRLVWLRADNGRGKTSLLRLLAGDLGGPGGALDWQRPVIVALLAFQVTMERWERWAPWLFVVSIVLLIVVLLPHVGKAVYGARRWIGFGPVNFQPSELAKIAVAALVVCRAGARRRRRRPAVRVARRASAGRSIRKQYRPTSSAR